MVLAACLGYGAFDGTAPVTSGLLGVLGISLALDRSLLRRSLPHDAQTRAPTPSDLVQSGPARLHELAGPAAWLDATTPVGLCLLGLLYAPGLWLATQGDAFTPWTCGALLATPLFVTATRLLRPVSARHVLHHLATLRRALEGLPARTELLMYTAADGRCLEARLRLLLPRVPAGMGKLELVVTDATLYGRPRWTLSWLAQCRAHSPADALLARALPEARHETCAGNERVARLTVTVNVAADAGHLLGWLAHETQSQAA
jgi:hypothetical protein